VDLQHQHQPPPLLPQLPVDSPNKPQHQPPLLLPPLVDLQHQHQPPLLPQLPVDLLKMAQLK